MGAKMPRKATLIGGYFLRLIDGYKKERCAFFRRIRFADSSGQEIGKKMKRGEKFRKDVGIWQ